MASAFTNYTIPKHAVAGSTSLLGTEGGAHIRNIKATANIDNGCIVGKGDWIEMEVYAEAAAGTFTGKILDQAANGNWYVEVATATNCWLVLTPPLAYEDWTAEMREEYNFYNAADEIMRCYELRPYDVFEVSAEAFDGTPAKGKSLTIVSKKLKVGS